MPLCLCRFLQILPQPIFEGVSQPKPSDCEQVLYYDRELWGWLNRWTFAFWVHNCPHAVSAFWRQRDPLWYLMIFSKQLASGWKFKRFHDHRRPPCFLDSPTGSHAATTDYPWFWFSVQWVLLSEAWTLLVLSCISHYFTILLYLLILSPACHGLEADGCRCLGVNVGSQRWWQTQQIGGNALNQYINVLSASAQWSDMVSKNLWKTWQPAMPRAEGFDFHTDRKISIAYSIVWIIKAVFTRRP